MNFFSKIFKQLGKNMYNHGNLWGYLATSRKIVQLVAYERFFKSQESRARI